MVFPNPVTYVLNNSIDSPFYNRATVYDIVQKPQSHCQSCWNSSRDKAGRVPPRGLTHKISLAYHRDRKRLPTAVLLFSGQPACSPRIVWGVCLKYGWSSSWLWGQILAREVVTLISKQQCKQSRYWYCIIIIIITCHSWLAIILLYAAYYHTLTSPF